MLALDRSIRSRFNINSIFELDSGDKSDTTGLVLNILIVSFAIVRVRMGLRRGVVYRRKCKSLCVHCAYPVGDFPVCPECGKPTEREA